MKDLYNKVFNNENGDKNHNKLMLVVYGLFIIIVLAIIRTSPSDTKNTNTDNKTSSITSTEKNNTKEKKTVKKRKIPVSDINYTYSYTVVFDGEIETYVGKKIDDKEKFSYIKGDTTLEYAILDGAYLLRKNGKYHITNTLDTYFRYCNAEDILDVIMELEPIDSEGYVYEVDNYDLDDVFLDDIIKDNQKTNKVELIVENNNLKKITLDLSNYVSSVLNSTHTLNITMEFANVGTTEDFDIKVN